MVPTEEIEEKTYIITSALSNSKVMDITGGVLNAKNGTNIQLFDSNSTEAQYWQIKNNNDGTYTIINPTTNKVLDVANAGTTDGTNIQLYGSNGTCAQKWKIVRENDGSYVFYSACSGMVIDVSGGHTRNGANIQIFTPNGTKAQKWNLDAAE